jgi:hypothetical protein
MGVNPLSLATADRSGGLDCTFRHNGRRLGQCRRLSMARCLGIGRTTAMSGCCSHAAPSARCGVRITVASVCRRKDAARAGRGAGAPPAPMPSGRRGPGRHRNGGPCAVVETAPFMGDSRNVVNRKNATKQKMSRSQCVGWVSP